MSHIHHCYGAGEASLGCHKRIAEFHSAHDIGRQKVGCFGFYERQLRGPCPTALVWSKRCLHEIGRLAQAGISRLNEAVCPRHGIPGNVNGQAGQIPGIGSCGRGFLRLPRWLHYCCDSTSLLRIVGSYRLRRQRCSQETAVIFRQR